MTPLPRQCNFTGGAEIFRYLMDKFINYLTAKQSKPRVMAVHPVAALFGHPWVIQVRPFMRCLKIWAKVGWERAPIRLALKFGSRVFVDRSNEEEHAIRGPSARPCFLPLLRRIDEP